MSMRLIATLFLMASTFFLWRVCPKWEALFCMLAFVGWATFAFKTEDQ
jgi:hypothetical protein